MTFQDTTTRFDEAWYLQANPDVDAAVAAGRLATGFEHFEKRGQAEGRLPFPGATPMFTEQERRDKVGQAWSVNPEQTAGAYWMAHPMVRARANRLASGNPAVDCYGLLRGLLQARGVPLPLGRAVSLGCGFGALEHSLAAEGIIREIDAYDIAPKRAGWPPKRGCTACATTWPTSRR